MNHDEWWIQCVTMCHDVSRQDAAGQCHMPLVIPGQTLQDLTGLERWQVALEISWDHFWTLGCNISSISCFPCQVILPNPKEERPVQREQTPLLLKNAGLQINIGLRPSDVPMQKDPCHFHVISMSFPCHFGFGPLQTQLPIGRGSRNRSASRPLLPRLAAISRFLHRYRWNWTKTKHGSACSKENQQGRLTEVGNPERKFGFEHNFT